MKDNNFDCSNESITDAIITNCTIKIGYSGKFYIPFIILAFCGLISTFMLIVNYWITKGQSEKNSQASLKIMFFILSIVDLLTSCYWIISLFFFKDAETIKKRQKACFAFSLIYLFIITFGIAFICALLFQFKMINFNPIEGILKPDKYIIKYIIISITIGIIVVALSVGLKVNGKSPMITCFLRTEFPDKNDNLKVFFVFLIPLLIIIFGIYQILIVFTRNPFENDIKLRNLFKKNTKYVIYFILLHLPLALVFIVTLVNNNKKLYENGFLGWMILISSLLTCAIPFIGSIIRVLLGLVRLEFLKELFINEKNKQGRRGIPKELVMSLVGDDFEWLEKHVMRNFMRDILIGISYCIFNSKEFNPSSEKPGKSEVQFQAYHDINRNNYKLDEFKTRTGEEIPFSVKFIEYSPKIFKYLRDLEKIDKGEMAKSFYPRNNKQVISQSEGKSGSFFISTDDNKFLIKTLKPDEFELIRSDFLWEFSKHMKKNPNSLLCPLYGIYKMLISTESEIIFIIMRNLIGNFKDNIICKYDLKGSTLGRKKDMNNLVVDKNVMKDLNFEEIEKALFLNTNDRILLKENVKSDSEFLKKMGLMDYSLFVVKLTLSKEQYKALFKDKKNKKKDDLQLVEANQYESSGNSSSILQIEGANIKQDNIYYKKFLFPSLREGTAFIIAIIDFLQIFNFFKVMESNYRYYVQCGGKNTLASCVDPKTYSERFIGFVEKITDINKVLNDGEIPQTTPNEEEEVSKSNNMQNQAEENNNNEMISNKPSTITHK